MPKVIFKTWILKTPLSSLIHQLRGENFWNIDDIQFSSQSIPEPSALGLLALGALVIAWRSRSNPVCDLPLLE